MKLYRIYEIPSFIQPDGSIGKVGCTSMTVEARALQQTYTDVNLLEEHTDIYEASDREIQLQKDYGYTVDKVPYWQSVENRYKFTSETATEAGRMGLKTSETQSHAGKAGGRAKRTLTIEQVKSIRKERKDLNTTLLELANKYNLSKTSIFKLINYKSYTDPEFLN
tara:strand:+ start:320 stop:817 length:498 start_codon:yes stop_codon:yes gene_type:complete